MIFFFYLGGWFYCDMVHMSHKPWYIIQYLFYFLFPDASKFIGDFKRIDYLVLVNKTFRFYCGMSY